MIDTYLSNTVLVRQGLFPGSFQNDADLDEWLLSLRNDAKFGWNLGAKRILLMSLWDRLHQDQVSIGRLPKGWLAFQRCSVFADNSWQLPSIFDR